MAEKTSPPPHPPPPPPPPPPKFPLGSVRATVLAEYQSNKTIALKPGETVRHTVADITLDSQLLLDGSCRGSLIVTNWRFVFLPKDKASLGVGSIECPLTGVESALSSKKSSNTLSLRTRDLRKMRFVFADDAMFKSIRDFLGTFASPGHPVVVFAYAHGQALGAKDKQDKDYSKSHMTSEYARLGITNTTSRWRISSANEDYSLCASYPPLVVVPFTVTDDMLTEVAKFRGNKRLPILVWKQPQGDCAIVRCSQPLVGPRRSRSDSDEAYLKHIHAANPKSPSLVILDARPKAFSVANMANGGGYEFVEFYTNCRVEFLGIDNIHAMRESHNQLFKLLNDRDVASGWRTGLDASAWVKHIVTILQGVERILAVIEKERCSVLVHCSDGWDRTNALNALAELCLDPYYRTLEGLEVLILKEWCWTGHKFWQRTFDPSERAPIFLQFIDCVHQLVVQFPTAFEFTTRVLVKLVDSLHDCRFGTFLGDYHKNRLEVGIPKNTVSVWWHIRNHAGLYKNPYYVPYTETLWPVITDRSIVFWAEFFCRHDLRLRNKSSLALNHRLPLVAFPPHSINQRLAILQMKLTKLKLLVPLTTAGVSGKESSASEKLFDDLFDELEKLKFNTTEEGYSSGEDEAEVSLNDLRGPTPGKSSALLTASSPGYATMRFKNRADLKSSRPTWMHDDHSKQCCHCRTKIGKGTRHHCRNCGLLFCGNCTNKKAQIPTMGYVKAVRVCDTCVSKLSPGLSGSSSAPDLQLNSATESDSDEFADLGTDG